MVSPSYMLVSQKPKLIKWSLYCGQKKVLSFAEDRGNWIQQVLKFQTREHKSSRNKKKNHKIETWYLPRQGNHRSLSSWYSSVASTSSSSLFSFSFNRCQRQRQCCRNTLQKELLPRDLFGRYSSINGLSVNLLQRYYHTSLYENQSGPNGLNRTKVDRID